MSREFVYEKRDLVDAGAMHYNVRAICRCGHSAILESIDLWWWFSKRGWAIRIRDVPGRLRCMVCFRANRPKRAPSLELIQKEATVRLPRADMSEWMREVRRRR